MTELIAFKRLPIVLVSEIMDWCRSPNQPKYLYVDKKTGKMYYRINVKLTAKIILSNLRNPLTRFTINRSLHWKEFSKLVTIHIENEKFPAFEYCLKFKDSKFCDDCYPELYVEYERNDKMEYLQFVGENCFGEDYTNPFYFTSALLHRFDETKGEYYSHWIEAHHAYDTNDYTRKITIQEPIDYLHECKALSNEYAYFKQLRDDEPDNTILVDMAQKFNGETHDMAIVISLTNYNFNPYSGAYEIDNYNN